MRNFILEKNVDNLEHGSEVAAAARRAAVVDCNKVELLIILYPEKIMFTQIAGNSWGQAILDATIVGSSTV